MHIQLADLRDVPKILQLHYQYHLDSITPEDKAHGFVTTPFTTTQLERLVDERGIVIALNEGRVLAYVMAASWTFWSQWPMFTYMEQELPKLNFRGRQLNNTNSYQYGPVCIAREFRGDGLLQHLFECSRQEMMTRYPFLVTFINKKNPRSYAAHTRKIGLEVIHEFNYNGGEFYELAYDTSQPLKLPI